MRTATPAELLVRNCIYYPYANGASINSDPQRVRSELRYLTLLSDNLVLPPGALLDVPWSLPQGAEIGRLHELGVCILSIPDEVPSTFAYLGDYAERGDSGRRKKHSTSQFETTQSVLESACERFSRDTLAQRCVFREHLLEQAKCAGESFGRLDLSSSLSEGDCSLELIRDYASEISPHFRTRLFRFEKEAYYLAGGVGNYSIIYGRELSEHTRLQPHCGVFDQRSLMAIQSILQLAGISSSYVNSIPIEKIVEVAQSRR